MSDETTRLLNGVPADALPLGDRGLAYGDGLFETLLVRAGQACLLQRHLARMQQGASALGISFPDIGTWCDDIERAHLRGRNGVLKLILTRGSGQRGYAPPEMSSPTRILEFSASHGHDFESAQRAGAALVLCKTPLSENPTLAGIKHLNRLDQVLAAAEVRAADAFEGLMRMASGEIICGTRSNLLIRTADGWLTPSLDRCGIAGVVRGLAIELAEARGESVRIGPVGLPDLNNAEAAYLTNSLMGVVPVARLRSTVFDATRWHRSLVAELQASVTQA